jgi:23S rRNA (adenine2503-C2)-methyltransferase
MERIFVKNYSLPELEEWVESLGERRFRARQLYRHLYARQVRSWDACTDLSRSFIRQLQFGTHLHALKPVEKRTASDDTVKYLFELSDGLRIESVLIPDPPRLTLCVSSQVGCALGCTFCLTGKAGLQRNLTTAEMVDQVCQVQQDAGKITNIVFMGMGEPMANYRELARALDIMVDPQGLGFSHRRLTVSTAGLIPQLERLGRDTPVNLAVSLHAPEDALRSRLMPVNRKFGLEALMAACREYPIPQRKRITFEYVLLKDVNDKDEHARKLVRLLRGVRCKVNLIPYNPHDGSAYARPSEARMSAFQEILTGAGVTATLRRSRGADIGAACGQLAGEARR